MLRVMAAPSKYPAELRERAVRLAFESDRPVAHVAHDLGIHRESLRLWVRQAEADSGRRRDLLTTSEREELKHLRKENAELNPRAELVGAAPMRRSISFDSPLYWLLSSNLKHRVESRRHGCRRTLHQSPRPGARARRRFTRAGDPGCRRR
jgi:transposase